MRWSHQIKVYIIDPDIGMFFTSNKMIYEKHGKIRADIRDLYYLRRKPAK